MKWWDEQHKIYDNNNNTYNYITNSSLNMYIDFFECLDLYIKATNILEIGIGTGRALKEMKDKNLYAVDISEIAFNRIKDIAKTYYIENLPNNIIDLIFCNLVAQHVTDDELNKIFKYGIDSLKEDGTFLIQCADSLNKNTESKELYDKGGKLRDIETVSKMIKNANGKITYTTNKRYFNGGSIWWYGLHIRRVK